MSTVLSRLRAVALVFAVSLGLLAGNTRGQTVAELSEVVYFSLKTPQAEPLSVDDITVFEDGEDRRVVEILRSSDGSTPATARQFIFFFDDDLNFRQLFHAKRAALDLIPLLGDMDTVALYRSGKLSGFFQGTQLIRMLVSYFGAEVDRFNESPGVPFRASFSPRQNLPNSVARRELLTQESREAFRQGVNGSLMSVLGYNRYNPGRKIVLYFGSNLPYRDPSPELASPEDAALYFADTRTTLFAFYFGPEDDTRSATLRRMAELSGGRAWTVQVNPIAQVLEAFEACRDFYYLRFATDASSDTRFREVRIYLSRGGELNEPTLGYFKTVERVHNLAGRTFDSVLLEPHRFKDIPLVVDVKRESDQVGVKVAFPFSDVRFDLVTQAGLPGDRYLQKFWLLVVVHGEDGRVLRSWARRFHLDLAERELLERLGSRATIEEQLPVSDDQKVGRVQVVLIAGMNRQISSQSSDTS